MQLDRSTRRARLAAALATAFVTATASADLTGTTMDVTVSHSGIYGFTATVTHTYGGASSTIPDPTFPAFFMILSSPAGAAGFDNSLTLDFTNFGYTDFAGETGDIEIANLAEDAEAASLTILDEDGTPIGVMSGSGDTFSGSWSVSDVLGAGSGTQLVVAWNSEPGFVPQRRMGDPIIGLTPEELLRFEQGRIDYNTPLLEEHGLGPVFNKESCGNCHANPLGGPGSQTVTRFGADDKKGKGFDPLTDLGGTLLQSQAIRPECQEVLQPEVTITSLRVTPGAMGYGLIEAIDDADLLALEASPPLPGISGVARIVMPLEDPTTPRVGRFGWKAQVATVLTFSADASLNEMGLTNRFLMEDVDPNGVRPPNLGDPDFCDMIPDPEDGPDLDGRHFIDRITDFQRFMTQPPQTPRSGMTGEKIFGSVGCTGCHVAAFTTIDDPGLEEALRAKDIRPYSDFLLHDMGIAADFIPDGTATEREIRTPPLWGVRTRDPMWHDGRIAGGTFEELMRNAIAEHGVFGSEAVDVIEAFDGLSFTDQQLLLDFLDSLGKLEYDGNGDEVIDLADFLLMVDCFGNGAGFVTPDDPCAVYDVDQDGDVDPDDYAGFLLVYTGPLEDCNDNGELDITEIIMGKVADEDGNGVPDECEACDADITGDETVDFQDLLNLLAAWGPCPACPEDLDGDNLVGFQDLLLLLSAWGPCP
jgi:hypothetical protein